MELLTIYQATQVRLAEATGATDALLHVHAGLAIFLLARVISGRSLATIVPLLCVWSVELLNEVLDYVSAGRLMPDTLTDIANTVFWPTLLFIGLRVRRAQPQAAGAQPEAIVVDPAKPKPLSSSRGAQVSG